jgi:hypothetical protein
MVLRPLESARITTIQSMPLLTNQTASVDLVLLGKALAAPSVIEESDAILRAKGSNPLPSKDAAPFPALLDNLSGLDLSRMEIALQYFMGLLPKTQPDVSAIIDPAQVLANLLNGQKAYTFSTAVLNAISDSLGIFANVAPGATSLSVGAAEAQGPIGFVYTVSQGDINLPSREISLTLTDSVGTVLAAWSYDLPNVLQNGGIFCWTAGPAERRVPTLAAGPVGAFGAFTNNSDISQTYAVSDTSNVFQVIPAPNGFRWVFSGANLNANIVPVDYTRETIYALYACIVARRLDLFPIWAMSRFGKVSF